MENLLKVQADKIKRRKEEEEAEKDKEELARREMNVRRKAINMEPIPPKN
jgi:hypothetical protein